MRMGLVYNQFKLPAIQRGFTIVELLIVVVVIAILATITVIAYTGITKRAIESSMKSDLRNATSTLEQEKVASGAYPISASAAGNGTGLKSSPGNSLTYTITSDGYCIAVVNPAYTDSLRIRSESGAIETGLCNSAEQMTVFGSDPYPYTQTAYSDGGGSLKMATAYYSVTNAFRVEGGRIYLSVVPSDGDLTLFYVTGSGTDYVDLPMLSDVPAGIPGQYVTIPAAELHIGWNEVTFPTSSIIQAAPSAYNYDDRLVWIGAYFEGGNAYLFTPSPHIEFDQSLGNDLYQAEAAFEGKQRSALLSGNTISSANLYGLDIIARPVE